MSRINYQLSKTIKVDNFHLIILVFFFVLLSACSGGGGGEGSSPEVAAGDNSNNERGIDPLYSFSWHLENTGQNTFATNSATAGVDLNLKNVISTEIKGSGITIAVSDSGIETSHEDLSGNYKSGISKNFLLTSPYNGYPIPNSTSMEEAHGTAVTGIIAAEGWNNKGSRGVAPKAKFGGFNYLATGVTQSIDQTLYQMTGSYDIFNYSYGSNPCRFRGLGAQKNSIINGYKNGITTLRNNKGAIYIKSAGNEFRMDSFLPFNQGGCQVEYSWDDYVLGNSTWLESNNLPYLVIVGAINAKGEKASYSSPGSNLWISGFGGEYGSTDPAILTTDLSGCSSGLSRSSNTKNSFEDGDDLNTDCKYTSTMNGTSSAAPTVSGVVALILQANPDLSWRDVKHILASTATINDPYTGFYTHPFGYDLASHTYQQRWVENGAGYFFHNYYGFGLVNTEAAVNMAKAYNIDLGTQIETINNNNSSWIYDSGTISQSIPNNSATGTSHTLNLKHNYIVEAVQVRVSVTHDYVENLGIELTSPSGVKSILTNINSGVLDYNINDATLLTNAFYGEESKGDWILKVIDGSNINADGTSGSSGTLTNWKIKIIGHKPVNPSDSTAPSAVASITHSSFFNSKTQSPAITFPASSSGDVLRYEISLGTTSGATNVVDWVSLGSARSHTFTGLNLTEGSSYFVNVRAIDTSENISPVTKSSGWTVDTQVLSTQIANNNGNLSVNSSSIVLAGNCEANSTLNVTPGSGVTVNSSSCNSSGEIALNLSFSNGIGSYSVTLSQTDRANNNSSNETINIFYIPRGDESITIGDFHGCIVDKNKNAKCWGSNEYGQLGNGSTSDNSSLVSVSGLSSSNVKSLAAGYAHTCAVTISGGVKCWGRNSSGQLGNNTTTNSSTPVDVTGLTSGVKYVVAGSAHSCALLTTGAVKCWGYNTNGSLGNSSTENSSTPVDVTGLSSGVNYIFSNRGEHTCALLSSGGLKCWGLNEFGQIGNNTTTNSSSPADVIGLSSGVEYAYTSGYSTCAKLSSGSFKCWGYNKNGQVGDGSTVNRLSPTSVSITSNIKEISVGEWNSCAFKNDNTTVCWGYNIYNQLSSSENILTTPISFLTNSVALRMGQSFMCSVNTAGNINCRGMRTYGQTGEGINSYLLSASVGDKFQVSNSAGKTTMVSIHNEHSCFVTSDNNTLCSGSNDFGELGDGRTSEGNMAGFSTPSQITSLNGISSSVASGQEHTCLLTTSGGVKCWGGNSYGQLGNGNNTNSSTPVDVFSLTSGVTKLSSGRFYSCALLSTGSVKCWGRNSFGELGNNSTTSSNIPVTISSLSDVSDIQLGHFHGCAINNNRVWCWGLNNYGQLGDGTTTNRLTPVNPNTSADVSLLSAGGWHTCAYTATNLLKCWGSNVNCALGNNSNPCTDVYDPTTTSVSGISTGVVGITSGKSHACVLMSNGDVKCWGSNSHGQLGSQTIGFSYRSPATFTSSNSPNLLLQKIFAGGNSTCGVTTSNDLFCWGDNTYGQRGDGKAASITGSTSAINANLF